MSKRDVSTIEQDSSPRDSESRTTFEDCTMQERPIFSGLKQEFSESKFSDVRIRTKDPDEPEGWVEIRSHRLILASLGPALARSLTENPTEEEDVVVIIPDVHPVELHDLLRNVYEGSKEVFTVSNGLDFLGIMDSLVNTDKSLVHLLSSRREKRQLKNVHYIHESSQSGSDTRTFVLNSDNGSYEEPMEDGGNDCIEKVTITDAATTNEDRVADKELFHLPELSVEEREDLLLKHLRAMDKMKPQVGRPKRSGRAPVWRCFTMTRKNRFAVCRYCSEDGNSVKFKVSDGVVPPMRRHIQKRHPEIWAGLEAEEHGEDLLVDHEMIAVDESMLDEEDVSANGEDGTLVEKKSSRNISVWNYFDDTSKDKCGCKLCSRVFKGALKTTTNIRRHLERYHKKEWEEFTKLEEDQKIEERKTEEDMNKKAETFIGSVMADKHVPESNKKIVPEEEKNPLSKNVPTFKTPNSNAKWTKPIWNYFSHSGEKKVQICKVCKENVASMRQDVNPLVKHLKNVHETLYDHYVKSISRSRTQEMDENGILKQKPKKRRKVVKKNGEVMSEEELLAARTCKECNKVFLNKNNMRIHWEAVHSGIRPFECDQCGMTFARKETFQRHIHDEVKPFLCTVCGKTFARKHVRDTHEKAHFGLKKFKCDYCNKTFTTGQRKRVHERIHTGDKPYKCKYCGRGFIQKCQLDTHERIHTGERPYTCEYCEQTFRHVSTKVKHNCAQKQKAEAYADPMLMLQNNGSLVLHTGKPQEFTVVQIEVPLETKPLEITEDKENIENAEQQK